MTVTTDAAVSAIPVVEEHAALGKAFALDGRSSNSCFAMRTRGNTPR